MVQRFAVESRSASLAPARLRGTLAAFRKLRKSARIEAAQDYLRRNPPPKSHEEIVQERLAKEPPIYRAFLHDHNVPASSFYDASVTEWTAHEGDPGKPVEWRVRDPFITRKFITYPFKSIEEIPRALVKLALGLKMGFRVPLTRVFKSYARYGKVLMPRGDTRAAPLAAKPENAHEVEGLAYGTALLFENEHHEDNGMIVEYRPNYPHGESVFGLSVWGRFYAIEIMSQDDFETNPSIPAV